MLALIMGSGFYEYESFVEMCVSTDFGDAILLQGEIGGRQCLLLPRHGQGHKYLSTQINHRANIAALKKIGATMVVSLSVMGSADPAIPPGSTVLAKDLYFPDNRLPSGDLATFFAQAGESGRGHLLARSLFNEQLTNHLQASLPVTPKPVVYGHVHGPRFNSQTEVNALRSSGVQVISQTCGPEAVLANELELPYALAGFVVDYANGVSNEPTSIDELQANLSRSQEVFAALLEKLPVAVSNQPPLFDNFIYRFD